MKRSYTDKEKLLVLDILEMSEGTAPVKLGFGYTCKDNRCHTGLVIYDCAGKIMSQLALRHDVSMSISDGVVHLIMFD